MGEHARQVAREAWDEVERALSNLRHLVYRHADHDNRLTSRLYDVHERVLDLQGFVSEHRPESTR